MDKTFDAAEAEPRLYEMWDEAGCFRAGANARPGAESFCIVIPPPNVTGSLHMGHAFNNTLQDILVRWHRMRGFDTLWQPGTDHAGIATQMVTERDMAANQEPSRTEMGREAFVRRVWQQKGKSGGTIKRQLRRLGASCDWERETFTMAGAPGAPAGEDGNFHDAVIRVFVEMYRKGLIYRGKRLVNWDPHFETAISDLEVENVEVDGFMWHFKYPLAGGESYEYVERDEDGNVTLRETRDYISIATTRPETMLGDGAVAVHPDDERYAPIVGKRVHLPLCDRLIPIITDPYPDPAFGSGAVKITGAHDFNDYAVASRNNIPLYPLMDTRARMRADGMPYREAVKIARKVAADPSAADPSLMADINLVPEKYRGLDRFEARKQVVADITAEGLAVTVSDAETGATVPVVEKKKIMQPFGDRSKVVIEPFLTDQWFVDAGRLVGPAIEAVRSGETEILPERDAKVYFHWLENIEPWCISRQLWWGHQIPVWYGPAKPEKPRQGFAAEAHALETVCCATEAEALAYFRDYYGGEVTVVDAPATPGEVADIAAKAGREAAAHPIWRDPDVLDTWFSSGLWPIGTLGWPEDTEEMRRYFPTSVLVTGFDIIFFWVARMMMMQYAIVGQKPFDTVYVHALVRDEKGKKMSKSLGNVLDPIDLIDEFGADAVRFTLAAMAAMGRDLKLSKDRIAGYRNFGTKLWNAVRFAEMNGVYTGGALPYAEGSVPAATETANRWILGETAAVREEVDGALAAFRFNDAAGALYAHVWGRVCDWYVEFAKPLFASEDPSVIAETRACMAWVLDQCLVLLHPFMPFVTEELWQLTADRPKMLIHADWPEHASSSLRDQSAEREMRWVIGLIEQIRSARAQVHVPVGAYLPLIAVELDEAGEAAWTRSQSLIMRLARIEGLERADAAPKGSVSLPVEGGLFALPLAGVIDVAEERARLEKTLGKLDKDLASLRGRLDNPKFRASAPEDVVDETRETLAQKEDEVAKIRAALDRLAELA